jgi:hypothetical protein
VVGAIVTAAIRAASLFEGDTWVEDPASWTAWPVVVDVITTELQVPVAAVDPEV